MTESIYEGYKRIDFKFEDMPAIILFPAKPNKNKNWILKTEYFDSFQNFEFQMLENGWHVAYIKNVTRWCLDEDIDRKKRFADFVSKEFGLYQKCFPVGMSCGGMIACKLAAKYPERVSGMYLDAPVMNLLSCPAGIGKAGNDMLPEFIKATGIELTELISYRNNPIDHMQELIDNNIPVFMAYGDSDNVVPYCENGHILESFYKQHGGIIHTFCRKGCGHHPHDLEDYGPVIEFAHKYSV